MIDPRVKLFAIFTLTSLAIFLKNPIALILLLLFSFITAFILKGDAIMLIKRISAFLYIIIGMSCIQILFVHSGNIICKIGIITITSDAVLRAFTMIVRIFVIVITSSIMSTENSSRVIASFSKIKIPYIISFMVMITLRFIPLYRESFSDALISIQLRGLDIKKVSLIKKLKIFSYLMLPVVYEAINKAEDLTIAMQARGFQAMKTRTNYIELKFKPYDYFLMILISVFSIFLISFI